MSKIQRLQNFAARVTNRNFDFINHRGHDMVVDLKWQDVNQRRDFLMSSLVYKCLHGLAPTYLTDSLVLASEMNGRKTRSSTNNDLYLPRANIDKFKESFIYAGSKTWNSLDTSLKDSCTVDGFKRSYKSLYFSIYNP